jgi:hypothetical protein
MLFSRGRRMFSLAAALMILTALAHTLGNLAGGPPDAADAMLEAAMRVRRVALGMGMNPSAWDIQRTLVFTMSITLAALGLMNLVLAASEETHQRLMRRVAWLNFVWVGAFTFLALAYRVPPPLISGLLIEAAVLGSLLETPA